VPHTLVLRVRRLQPGAPSTRPFLQPRRAASIRMTLKARLILRFAITVAILAALLFLPAGGFNYWQAWVYLAIVFIPMLFSSFYFYKYDPQLVEARMRTKETVREQKLIVKLGRVVFLGVLLLPGFDHRFGWSNVPLWLTILSQAISLIGYLLTFWVMKVNSFASRIIEVQSGQEVISTGPYRWVRHPMYLGAIVMFLFMPLALGSYWTLPPAALVVPVIVFRLLNEEKVLLKDLPGYSEYCAQTRFHLIPFVW
jgi:protein-S-isoprenylcysteine O-methyltransferase Ste14